MNPCNSLISFSGSIYNHRVTHVRLYQDIKKCQNQRSEEKNCLTAANTSHNYYEEEIFKLLNLCGTEKG